MKPKQPAEEWEKEFENKWSTAFNDGGFVDFFTSDSRNKHEIKAFIRSLLSQQRQDLLAESINILEKAKISCGESCGSGCEYAVEEVIVKLRLKQLEGGK